MKNTFHLKAPGNWLNDPNGFIYYRGKYHMFYQHFPYEPIWSTIHWGHAVSEDLVHWQHLGIAIYPSKAYDRNGIHSGSAVEVDGKLYLYYTGVRYHKENPEYIHLPLRDEAGNTTIHSQVLLVSEDGFHFDNRNGKIRILDKHGMGDPKVWREKNQWYMCLGSNDGEKGMLLLYKSVNGVDWESSCSLQNPAFARHIECPDLFKVDGKYVLFSSPVGILDSGEYAANQTICQLAEFDGEKEQLAVSDTYRFADYGMEAYAPQSNLDEEGRRVMFYWVRMSSGGPAGKPENNTASGGRFWNGMLSLPRVVSIRENHVYTSVHPNVRMHFAEEGVEKKSAAATLRRTDGKMQEITEWIC